MTRCEGRKQNMMMKAASHVSNPQVSSDIGIAKAKNYNLAVIQ
jgi:hypothetical protein